MLSQKKPETESERLDRLGQEALRAARLSETEIETIADAPDLYARLRQRIAAEERQRANGGLLTGGWWARLFGLTGQPALSVWRRPVWPLAAAVALLVLLAMLVPSWLQMPAPEPRQVVSYPLSPSVRVAPSIPASDQASTSAAQSQSEQKSTNKIVRASASKSDRPLRPRVAREESLKAESATEFIPLMYWPEGAAHENSRVVRIKVPRSTLVSFGLPMNTARASELVNADVVLGDDGLARAIRFIY